MLSCEPGCTMANPPDTMYGPELALASMIDCRRIICFWTISRSPNNKKSLSNSQSPTEELLAAPALLDDLDEARLQLFNGRYMIRQYSHFSRFSGYVDLNTTYKSPISTRFQKMIDASGIANACSLQTTYTSVDLYIDCVTRQLAA